MLVDVILMIELAIDAGLQAARIPSLRIPSRRWSISAKNASVLEALRMLGLLLVVRVVIPFLHFVFGSIFKFSVDVRQSFEFFSI